MPATISLVAGITNRRQKTFVDKYRLLRYYYPFGCN